MKDKLQLMIPGPTPVPERVLLAMARHPIGHRSGEFQAIVARTTEQLKWLHQTSQDVLVLAGSGTAAMEAGIINVLSHGDKVICGDNGKFGERWVKVAKAYGLDVEVIQAEWGQPLDPESFRAALEADTAKAIKAVIITHSETSTGVINDLETINQPGRHLRARGSLGARCRLLRVPEGLHDPAWTGLCGHGAASLGGPETLRSAEVLSGSRALPQSR